MYQVKRIKKILSGSTTKTAFLFLFFIPFHEHEFWPGSEEKEKKKKKKKKESCHAVWKISLEQGFFKL